MTTVVLKSQAGADNLEVYKPQFPEEEGSPYTASKPPKGPKAVESDGSGSVLNTPAEGPRTSPPKPQEILYTPPSTPSSPASLGASFTLSPPHSPSRMMEVIMEDDGAFQGSMGLHRVHHWVGDDNVPAGKHWEQDESDDDKEPAGKHWKQDESADLGKQTGTADLRSFSEPKPIRIGNGVEYINDENDAKSSELKAERVTGYSPEGELVTGGVVKDNGERAKAVVQVVGGPVRQVPDGESEAVTQEELPRSSARDAQQFEIEEEPAESAGGPKRAESAGGWEPAESAGGQQGGWGAQFLKAKDERSLEGQKKPVNKPPPSDEAFVRAFQYYVEDPPSKQAEGASPVVKVEERKDKGAVERDMKRLPSSKKMAEALHYYVETKTPDPEVNKEAESGRSRPSLVLPPEFLPKGGAKAESAGAATPAVPEEEENRPPSLKSPTPLVLPPEFLPGPASLSRTPGAQNDDKDVKKRPGMLGRFLCTTGVFPAKRKKDKKLPPGVVEVVETTPPPPPPQPPAITATAYLPEPDAPPMLNRFLAEEVPPEAADPPPSADVSSTRRGSADASDTRRRPADVRGSRRRSADVSTTPARSADVSNPRPRPAGAPPRPPSRSEAPGGSPPRRKTADVARRRSTGGSRDMDREENDTHRRLSEPGRRVRHTNPRVSGSPRVRGSPRGSSKGYPRERGGYKPPPRRRSDDVVSDEEEEMPPWRRRAEEVPRGRSWREEEGSRKGPYDRPYEPPPRDPRYRAPSREVSDEEEEENRSFGRVEHYSRGKLQGVDRPGMQQSKPVTMEELKQVLLELNLVSPYQLRQQETRKPPPLEIPTGRGPDSDGLTFEAPSGSSLFTPSVRGFDMESRFAGAPRRPNIVEADSYEQPYPRRADLRGFQNDLSSREGDYCLENLPAQRLDNLRSKFDARNREHEDSVKDGEGMDETQLQALLRAWAAEKEQWKRDLEAVHAELARAERQQYDTDDVTEDDYGPSSRRVADYAYDRSRAVMEEDLPPRRRPPLPVHRRVSSHEGSDQLYERRGSSRYEPSDRSSRRVASYDESSERLPRRVVGYDEPSVRVPRRVVDYEEQGDRPTREARRSSYNGVEGW